MSKPDLERHTLAEWSPQHGVLLTWPHRHSDWEPVLDEVESVYTNLTYHLSCFENVVICCQDQTHLTRVTRLLERAGADMARVSFYIIPANDTWTRDYGPLTITESNDSVLLDFTFNGWGNKFNSDLDNQVTQHLHTLGAFGSVSLRHIDMVLEGGSVDFDGQETLLTTSQCLLNPNRNPHLDRREVETLLKDTFGISRVLWLEHGMLIGDDTDSHIDVLARFCNSETIAYTSCNDKAQHHYDELKLMEDELASFTTCSGKAYRLVALPLPAPIYDPDGLQLPASYANFLIINKAILVPAYQDPMDKVIQERLGACFPGREIIGIDCMPLISQHGSLHCITMQLPVGIFKNKA